MRGDKALREIYEEPEPQVSLATKKSRARKAAKAVGHRLSPFKTSRDFNQVSCQANCLECNLEVKVYPDAYGPVVHTGRRRWLHGKEEPGSFAAETWPDCGP